MNRIPIAFAFDNNLAMPAAVCFYSLLDSARESTAYDIYVLHRRGEALDTSLIEKVMRQFPQSTLTLREVGDEFDGSFEIRGITTPAYYRLLIPDLIPEHDRILYSDVDVIFRQDLSEVYSAELGDNYFIGVNAIAHLDRDLDAYYQKLGLDSEKIIYSGNLLINSALFRENPEKLAEIRQLAKNDYKFQDMDVINIACEGNIGYVGPEFCLSTYIGEAIRSKREKLTDIWSEEEIDKAMQIGLVHYNGQKPWRGWCLNFDIWWEYYRKSPIFDADFYFRFYFNRLEELDTLPLKKRVKNLVRYFVYGRKKLI